MKFKLNVQIKDPDGVDLVSPLPVTPEAFVDLLPNDLKRQVFPYLNSIPKENVTLKKVCNSSIVIPLQGDDEEVKMKKYEIWKLLRDSQTEVELTAEQVTLLKKCIGKLQPPVIMGQAFEIIEGKEL
jgi:hypothetical protein